MKKDSMMKDVKKYAAGGMTDGRDRSEQSKIKISTNW